MSSKNQVQNTVIKTAASKEFIQRKRDKEVYLTEERMNKLIPQFTDAISFWREYPDIFIDQIKGPDSKFEFFFYQRVFLRAAMRHRYFFGTFN